ncbi:hypothetical protein MNBD_GAMMA24-1737 [hydrothermal vent metagenome]|uniref:DUF7939 domain-containing protein n=1 Tax=hydrothermal vent metagenome TaxID=652676 RepID=A0A3B1C7D4_9ZZZZ
MTSRTHSPIPICHPQALWQIPLLVLLVMLAVVSPSNAAVRASLGRSTISAADTVTLTIESDSRDSDLQPDLSPLKKDFDVLGTSTSTQVSIFNGQRADKTLWQVQLQPRHSGTLRIPSISLGTQQTAPLELKVSEEPQQATAAIRQHVFVEAEINPTGKHIYVQQQIPYTVRLYYDESLQQGELGAPEPKDAVVEQLGEDKRYSAFRNGRQYNVIERHYVISPEKSGALQIPPASFHGRITLPRQREPAHGADSLMEQFFNNSPFANDPFFRGNMLPGHAFGGSPFSNPGKPITVHSRVFNLKIKPRPSTVTSNWLPAESVTLTDSWSKNPPQFKVGEPVMRTITIHTQGLAGSQIPELAIAAPPHTRLYPETPKQESRTDGNTIYGTRSQTLTYIANASGSLKVPAVTLKWWDTRHNRAASTSLPAWQFKVQPGAAGNAAVPPAAKPSPRPALQQSTTKKPAAASKSAHTDKNLGLAIVKRLRANWPRLLTASGLFLALVLLLIFLARRAKQKNIRDTSGQTPSATPQRPKADQKTLLQALQKACTANDPHAAASALLKLAQAHWPDDPPRNLDALATRVDKGQAQLKELDRSLYAANSQDWNGAALWNEFSHGLQQRKENKQQDDVLSPLYPQHS